MYKGIDGLARREAVLAICLAISLTACGGGGGNSGVKGSTPVVTPPPPVTPPPTDPTPPPSGPTDPTDIPYDVHLSLTNTYAAHTAGFDGSGVTIGFVDTGVMSTHPALAGRVLAELIYVDPTVNNTAVDDVVGHGTAVAEIAAGKPFANFAGGIAPGASIVSARIINDQEPTDDGSGQGNQVSNADPLYQVSTDLATHGVSIMNNSWGGLYWDATQTAVTQSFHDAYAGFISGGGLVVFAAGNSSAANPSDVAALPSRAPDLEYGWLAVVALNSSNPTQLAAYSNQCGIAMAYCLAAPGDVVVSDRNDTATSQKYFVYEGTSLAAPAVSGAAAVVWQAFPGFKAKQVWETLLGTATDLGAPGPDPVFGYGALDVGRAVRGPERFDWDDFAYTGRGNSNFGNDISGIDTYGLIYDGQGTLTLSGTNTYHGVTSVSDAQATLDAVNMIPGDAAALQGGTLIVRTGVAGKLDNNDGVVQTGDGPATVGGSYTQTPAGRLAEKLGAPLRVTGTASIAGDLTITGAISGYVASTQQEVLSAAGGVTGTFATLTAGSGVMINTTLNYLPNEVWIDATRVNVTQVQGMSSTPLMLGSAQRVEGAFQQIDHALSQPSTSGVISDQTLIGAASIQQASTTAVAQKSIASLSGQLHAASAAMTFEAIDAGTRALSDRFDALAEHREVGAWTQNLGYHGSMSRSGYSNVGYDLGGTMIGQDLRIGTNGFAGFALSQAEGLGRLAESADQGHSRSVEGMIYGGMTSGQWYSMGRVGLGNYREDMRRGLLLGDSELPVGSQQNGRYTVAYGETGFRAYAGAMKLTPFVNLQYAQIDNGGFNEFGGDGFGLAAGAQSTSRWQGGAGMRLAREWALPSGGSLSLRSDVGWQHSFATRGEVFAASFTGIQQWAPVGGIGLSRYGGFADLTLDWRMTDRVGMAFGYDQQFGQLVDGRTATASFHINF
ncbi:MAG TPA: S8 family serine peptidase [Luteibacter sp.]|nr:S8 family serine peptidase [Luteibacter sp.]